MKVLIRRLRPDQIVTIYTNIDIENANWMPDGDIHHWYRRFMQEMGWKTRIRSEMYTYPVPSDLKIDPQNTEFGAVTYDSQVHELAFHGIVPLQSAR